MDYRLILGAAAVGVVALSGRKKRGGAARSSAVQKVSPQATLINPAASMEAIELPQPDWPKMKFDIPFAAGNAWPVWPTISNHKKKFVISYRTVSGPVIGNGARRFMCDRSGDGRYHVGIDLYGYPDDPILAMENGTIVNHYHFYHGTHALFLQCDSGLVINYGEVKKNSWSEFGLSKGSKVKKGQPIARVGLMSGGSHMLHFETYMPPTTKNKRYFGDDVGPILNPTYYLLRARFLDGAGRTFSGTDCVAEGSLNRPVPESLQHIAREDEALGEAPGDSVLPELLTDDMWRAEKDRSDGP